MWRFLSLSEDRPNCLRRLRILLLTFAYCTSYLLWGPFQTFKSPILLLLDSWHLYCSKFCWNISQFLNKPCREWLRRMLLFIIVAEAEKTLRQRWRWGRVDAKVEMPLRQSVTSESLRRSCGVPAALLQRWFSLCCGSNDPYAKAALKM